MLCTYVMNILCTFHIFMYGFVTDVQTDKFHFFKLTEKFV